MSSVIRVTRQMAIVINRRLGLFSIALLFICIIGLEIQINRLQAKTIGKNSDNPTLNQKYQENGDVLRLIQDQSNSNFFPIVVYNRIAKTGSTSFAHQVYARTKKNKIYVTHVNITKNLLKLSLADQYDFVWNVTKWQDKKPAFYHGHFGYISFSQFGAPDPLYINILREPLDRLVSFYYFIRYGDNYRKGLKRSKQGDTTTFDECVANGGHDCQPQRLWLQIPMMCGQSAECWKPGSQWALDEAKRNLRSKYMLVGVTEQMEDFIAVLEATVPSMFRGMTESYRKGEKSYVRKTIHKDFPSSDNVAKLKSSKIYKMEKELYDTAVTEFAFLKHLATTTDEHGMVHPLPKRYRYEKMYGPNGVNIK